MTFSILGLLAVLAAWQTPDEGAAEESARAWLALVDEGEYDPSWAQAAELFRGAVTKEDWAKAMNGSRKPLGRLISRKLKSSTYAESLPGAPDGKYVVLQFDTSFENKKSAIETVTPMLDRDGVWRVSGYFIK
jgi:hypothetical protein